MAYIDEVALRCISITEVPTVVPFEVIEQLVNKHFEDRMTPQWVELPQSESDGSKTRYLFKLQSENQAEKLSESIKQDVIQWNGQSWTVHFVRTLACEVPSEWMNSSGEDERDCEKTFNAPMDADGGEAATVIEPQSESERTVKVKGASCVSSRDLLELYFENRRSKGGEIEKIKTDDEDEDIVYITFKDKTVAQAVANKPNHVVNKQSLDVSLLCPPKESILPEVPLKKVCVCMSTPVDRDTLDMYFESKKRSGGGDIEALEIDPNNPCMAYVIFEDEEVAERVVERSHKLAQNELKVTLCQPSPNKKESKCTIKVTGVGTFEVLDPIEMYFESKRRSGGGYIADIRRDEEDMDVAYITFENEEVMKSVCERDRHRVNNQALSVETYSSRKQLYQTNVNSQDQGSSGTQDDKDEDPIRSVKVVGWSKIPSKEKGLIYFNNAQQSGGADMETNLIDAKNPDIMFITYKEKAVALEVATRSPHRVDDQELVVTLFEAPKSPPNYPDRVLIMGLGPNTSKECLFNFLKANSQEVPVKLTYGATEGTVMVTFQAPPDFNKLLKINGIMLDGFKLTVCPIPVSNCIYVTNVLESVSSDALKVYFEDHRRSNGGLVHDIVLIPEECAALVHFEDVKTVDNVLSQNIHEVDNQKLGVQLYIESLGCAEGGDSESVFTVPYPIKLQDLDEQKLQILQNSSTLNAALEKQMSDCHAKIHWNHERTAIQIECTLTKDDPGYRKMAVNWRNHVDEKFKDFFNQIKIE